MRAFAQGRGISDQLADPFALRVMELSRKVGNELDKLLGFVRFQDLGSILVAQLAPKCNMVPLMMDHFSDRFPDENFILYDENRNLAAVHEAGHSCVLVSGEQFQIPQGIWIILLCYGNSILPPWKSGSVTMSNVRIIFYQNGIANI